MKNTTIIQNGALLVLAAALATGCTHAVKITKSPPALTGITGPAQPMRVGFAPVGNDPLLTSAVKELKANSSIAAVKEEAPPAGGSAPDYVCQLTRETKFKSSGQNFFITYPGFIIFTHALLGYQYTADIVTRSTLLDANSNVVSQVTIDTPYKFRHCGFGRGATTSCIGWLTPGYGAANIIPGVIFASTYDKSATPGFLERAAPSYGSYVAGKVLEQLAQAQAGGVNAPPAVAVLDPKRLMPVGHQPVLRNASDAPATVEH